MNSTYIIFGEERFLVRRELERIKKSNPQAEIETLEGISSADLTEKIFLPSLFAPKKTFIIYDFNFSEMEDRLITAISSLPEGLLLIFISPKNMDRRTKIFKTVEPLVELIECPKIQEWDEGKLVDWVIAQAANLNKKISRTTAELLIEYAGFEMGILFGEIEKLSVYLLDKSEITKEDVELLVPKTGYDGFSLTEALGRKDRQSSFDALQRLFIDRQEPIPLLGLIASQFRNLYKVKLLQKRNRSITRNQAAQALKSSPYYMGKILDSAGNYKEEELERGIDALCQTDIRLKSGFDPKVELSLLLLELLGEKGKN